jgi:DNA-binding CsgD family transcriptional regulator
MRNDLVHTLDLVFIKIDHNKLDEIREKIHTSEESCFFLFDLLSGKCCYFCPSIISILGYDHRKYLNKGYLFFKSIIHPQDFLFFIDELLTLIASGENTNEKLFYGNPAGITIRIRNMEGNWTSTRICLVYLKETCCKIDKILLGFIEKESIKHNALSVSAFNITTREKEVFRYLSEGQSAKMIADILSISEATVITHRKNLIQKLSVKNSAELIKKGFEFNLLL